MSCHVMSCYVYVMLCVCYVYVMCMLCVCYVMLCYVMLCYVMLCYVMLAPVVYITTTRLVHFTDQKFQVDSFK